MKIKYLIDTRERKDLFGPGRTREGGSWSYYLCILLAVLIITRKLYPVLWISIRVPKPYWMLLYSDYCAA